MASKKFRVRTDDLVLGHYRGQSNEEIIENAMKAHEGIHSFEPGTKFYVRKAGNTSQEVEVS